MQNKYIHTHTIVNVMSARAFFLAVVAAAFRGCKFLITKLYLFPPRPLCKTASTHKKKASRTTKVIVMCVALPKALIFFFFRLQESAFYAARKLNEDEEFSLVQQRANLCICA